LDHHPHYPMPRFLAEGVCAWHQAKMLLSINHMPGIGGVAGVNGDDGL
jgi:hypothetical protein